MTESDAALTRFANRVAERRARPPVVTKEDPWAPREFRWTATFGAYDLDDPIGWGPTEEAAREDLMMWVED